MGGCTSDKHVAVNVGVQILETLNNRIVDPCSLTVVEDFVYGGSSSGEAEVQVQPRVTKVEVSHNS